MNSYLAMVGSIDDKINLTEEMKRAEQILKLRKGFAFKVIDGMGHSLGTDLHPWLEFNNWMLAELEKKEHFGL